MEIIVKKRSADTFSGKLSLSERRDAERRKAELEDQLHSRSSDYDTSHLLQDRGSAEKQLKQINETLAADSAKAATGKDKDALTKERRKLEAQIKKRMPPMKLQNAKEGTPEFEQALKYSKMMASVETTELCNRYKDVCRQLEPDDPNAGSVEKILKD